MRKWIIGGSLLTSLLVGCGGSTETVNEEIPAGEGKAGDRVKTDDGKAESFVGRASDPSGFSTGLNYNIAQLPMEGQATNIPWAASYWPTYQDNINFRWNGASTDSAAAKYAKAFGLGVQQVEDAVSRNHGIESLSWAKTCTASSECNSALAETCAKRTGATSGRCIPTWFGICHAWAPASIMEPEPKNPVTVNGVTFKVNDIKALLELTWNSTSSKFISLRCEAGSDANTSETFDNYGRPTGEDCRDTNAGAWHVIATNYLGIQKVSFVEDRTRDYQVWNQPMRGYRITQQTEVNATRANQLIGVTDGSTSYRFNSSAAKFYHVKMTAYYISESPSSTDGNLASTIDRYTHSDSYEYVLETDASGKILGGEWVGASKRNHPDFLWLPTGRRGTVAGGLITYANVKNLLDQSVASGGTGGSTGTDRTVTDSATLTAGAWKHYGPFNVAAGTDLRATLSGTGGDADLYVRRLAAPTTTAYDCRPYLDGSNESCTVAGGGQVYVSVQGYAASSTYSLTINFREGGGSTPPPPPATVTHLNESGSVAQGEMKLFTVAVQAGRKIVVRTQAPNDVDLYIRMGSAPTTSSYLQRGYTDSGNETLTYTPTSNGTLHIGVHGYVASTYTLTTADN